jgi:hypothetical protein
MLGHQAVLAHNPFLDLYTVARAAYPETIHRRVDCLGHRNNRD